MATVRDILKALDVITGGRVITDSFGYGGANPFVVTKTSGIPGKAVTELPGLVWGDPDMPVKKVAVMMTLTESAFERMQAKNLYSTDDDAIKARVEAEGCTNIFSNL